MPLFLEFLLLGLFGLAIFGAFRFLVSRIPGNRFYKYGLAMAGAAGFFLFWVNGAVGIIGSENNDANMMYMALLLGAFLAALTVRFKPVGMAWVMFVSTAGFALIAVLALVFEMGVTGPVSPWDVLMITAFFMGVLAMAGWFFQEAARAENEKVNEAA